jgi:hypothetical protein
MVGPSAIGSENGTPSSMMSAPPATSACISGTVWSGSRVAGGDERDQRLAALRLQALETVIRDAGAGQNWMPDFSATVCMSLSPRPERLTSRILSLGQGRRQLGGVGQGVAGFQRRDDAFVRHRSWKACSASSSVIVTYSARPMSLSQACSGRRRVVEAGRDRMGLDDLAVLVLQQVGAVAVQHAGRPAVSEAECLPVSRPSPAASTPISARPRADVGIEDAHRVGAAADAGDHASGWRRHARHLLAGTPRRSRDWKSRTIIG